ncbi:MAG TPA: hypothetical protein VNB59_00615 [Solirubrobacterales bacterium]|jgi:hypothetical protein|nr:hypothetical protein [Solirubrobacterales bacterium]
MAVLVLLAVAGTALALRLQAGPVVIKTDGGFSPTTLPKHHFAPIKLHGYGEISTEDGSLPPILKQLVIWFDKHGEVETRGLPVCTPGKLAATTTPQARKLCPGSIVGKGFGKAVVNFPEQGPIPASSAITLFNGPKKHGNPTVLAHAHLTVPGPTTFVVPIEIQRVHDGRYGFKTVAEIPRIAGGYGTPIYGRLSIGREWKYHGQTLSYANASCPDGRLQAKGQFRFKDGTFLQGSIFKRCTGT